MIFWIAIVLVVILTAWYFMRNGNKKILIDRSNEPAELLKERLAKGEITEEEYDKRLAKLNTE